MNKTPKCKYEYVLSVSLIGLFGFLFLHLQMPYNGVYWFLKLHELIRTENSLFLSLSLSHALSLLFCLTPPPSSSSTLPPYSLLHSYMHMQCIYLCICVSISIYHLSTYLSFSFFLISCPLVQFLCSLTLQPNTQALHIIFAKRISWHNLQKQIVNRGVYSEAVPRTSLTRVKI